MRLSILAMGSRGDVQPYVALGVGLRRAGHAVTIATHDEFLSLVTEHGLEFHSVGGDPRAMLENELGHEMLACGLNTPRFLRIMAQLVEPVFRQFVEESARACEKADGIILSNMGVFAHRLVQPPVPYVTVCLQPFYPTGAFASAFFPDLPAWTPFRGAYNRWSHRTFGKMFWRLFGQPVEKIQREMSLPLPDLRQSQLALHRYPILHAFSPSLIPRPAEWPENLLVTGYLFLDHPDWTPPAELAAFLEAGPPPVYIGFGSMRNRDPEEVGALAIAALRKAGQRGILLRGWGGLNQRDVPDDVLLIDGAPHDWLFPRMAAVVHHGGAGTTAAGLRAGVPSIVFPFFADQPFWARRVHQAGVGPKPIPRQALTSARLAHAIRHAINDPAIRQRAATLGHRIQAEDGVGEAVRIIEEYLTPRVVCS